MSSKPLIKFDDENVVTVDESLLRSVLLADDIKKKYVSVISIVGGFRQGKSFLMNFLLRYLEVTCKGKRNVAEWLTPEDGPIKGFPFKSSTQRETRGIQMWSEVFLTRTTGGEEIGVVLIDTEGCFDPKNETKDDGKIFTFSSLISSVQIYNIERQISTDKMDKLECFRAYANLFESNRTIPCQKLWLLIRDFANEDMTGSEYLEECLNDSHELKRICKSLNQDFENIDCFVLPDPGKIVKVSQTFQGDLNVVDSDFKVAVMQFVSKILSPEAIFCKTVNGKKVTAEELVYYVGEYAKSLKDGSVPNLTLPKDKSEDERKCKDAVEYALRKYVEYMDVELRQWGEKYTVSVCESSHNRITKYLLIKFDCDCEGVDPAIKLKYKQAVVSRLEGKRPEYVNKAEAIERERNRKMEIDRKELQKIQDEIRSNQQGLLDNVDGTAIATTAAVLAGAATLAFGVFKLFSSNNRND